MGVRVKEEERHKSAPVRLVEEKDEDGCGDDLGRIAPQAVYLWLRKYYGVGRPGVEPGIDARLRFTELMEEIGGIHMSLVLPPCLVVRPPTSHSKSTIQTEIPPPNPAPSPATRTHGGKHGHARFYLLLPRNPTRDSPLSARLLCMPGSWLGGRAGW